MFEFLSKINFGKGVQIALIAFGNIVAPFFFLYNCFRHVILENNTIEIIILCLAIAAPFTLVQYMVTIRVSNLVKVLNSDDKQSEAVEILIMTYLTNSSIATAITFYFASAVKIIQPNLHMRSTVFVMTLFTVLFSLLEVWEDYYSKKRLKKKKASADAETSPE